MDWRTMRWIQRIRKRPTKEDQQRKNDLHAKRDQIGNMFVPVSDPAVGLCYYLLRDFRGDLGGVQIRGSEKIIIHGKRSLSGDIGSQKFQCIFHAVFMASLIAVGSVDAGADEAVAEIIAGS